MIGKAHKHELRGKSGDEADNRKDRETPCRQANPLLPGFTAGTLRRCAVMPSAPAAAASRAARNGSGYGAPRAFRIVAT